jgi:acylphosphatase
MSSRKYIVRGKVQGVWFRESTRRVAVKLGMSGRAINLPDGTVEVLASGEPEALSELEKFLREGPPMARVDELITLDCEQDIPAGFTTA